MKKRTNNCIGNRSEQKLEWAKRQKSINCTVSVLTLWIRVLSGQYFLELQSLTFTSIWGTEIYWMPHEHAGTGGELFSKEGECWWSRKIYNICALGKFSMSSILSKLDSLSSVGVLSRCNGFGFDLAGGNKEILRSLSVMTTRSESISLCVYDSLLQVTHLLRLLLSLTFRC